MNVTPSLAPTSELRELYLALDPKSVYEELRHLAPELIGAEVRGAYLVDDHLGFVRDEAFGDASTPESWHLTTAPPPDTFTPIMFRFRGRPLGAVLVDADAEVDVDTATLALEDHLAPILFRTTWLADALDESTRTREQVRFLQEMGSLLGRIDLQPLLINVLDLVCGFVNAPIGSIVLREDDGELRTAVDWGLPLDALMSLQLEDGGTPLECAFESREPRLFRARELSCPTGPGVPERLLILPLLTNSGRIGAIALTAERENNRLNAETLDVVRPAVGLAATAIENARLFAIKLEREKEQQQLTLARRIQAGLLPSHPPPVDGIQLAATSVSANMIGGDYFDYFTLPDGTLGLVVADVAGKGIPAGLIMTAARAMFRAAALEQADPASILARVNRSLAEEDFNNRFVTAILARVDLGAGEVTVSCAGHEPLMIRRPGGPIERVGRPALPLGIMKDAEYTCTTATIGSDDVFVLFTDGVTEAMDPDRQQFGAQRLAEVLDDVPQDAERLRDEILERIAYHVGSGARHDDTTLIVARVVEGLREPLPEEPAHPCNT